MPESAAGRCVIVGEVAQAHDGSLGTAHAFIDAIAEAGADGVKFQTHIARAESTPAEPWRVPFSRQDASRYDYWKRMEFTEEQWAGLRAHADERGLRFYSSPFSIEALDLLTRVGVAAWKVASGEVANVQMLDRMAATGLPMIVSTGMSPMAEIDAVVTAIRDRGLDLTLLQCTTMYPTPPERLGLNVIELFRQRYGCAVGLSDHSGTIHAGVAAATVGIDMLEVHVTLSRRMFGPDVPASITPEELRLLVEGVRFIERARANPVDKDAVAEELAGVRDVFTKSVVAAVDLPAGAVLGPEHLTVKKPGGGIPPEGLAGLVGRRVRTDLPADTLIDESHLE
ncbi:MAG: N-acetylneuraminate synthase family protein [Actinomycetota bacterium]|nr:N-acetylneuraminate synthase family protein [Actinomycetota bacterium]